MVETWVILGLSGAFVVGLFNIYQKYLIDNGHSPLKIIVDMHIVATLVMFTSVLFVPIIITKEILILLLITGVLNGVSFWLLALAYQEDALSLIAPLRGFTPILVAFMEPLFFDGLAYNIYLVLASIIVAIGIYVLTYEGSMRESLHRIMNGGIKKGLISAAVISFAVIADRYAIVNTEIHPVMYAAYVMFSALIFSFIIGYYYTDDSLKEQLIPEPAIIPLGVLRGISVAFAFGAFLFAEGTRVNVLWQLGGVFATIFGGSLLKDDDLVRRSIGATMIVVAAAIVVLA